MFTVTERELKGLIAPTTPFYGTQSEWMRLEEGELTTFSDIYRNQPSVRSVVDFIAGHCARMPIKLFKQEGGGSGDSNEGDREHMRRHPAQKLLNVPNGHKRVGRANFWTDAWKDFLIYDRLCLVKIKDLTTGDPVALVRVPPMWFTPAGGSYFYPETIRIVGNRGMHDIPIENCIYIHGYDPVDPRIGVSPMTALMNILQEEAAASAWRKRFWQQGVQASMVVSRPVDAPEWDDGARDRFIESLRAASNRGRPLLLEEGMTVNPAAAFNPQSAQYIQSKEFTREEVLRVYNLPIGLFEQTTSANIAQYRAMLYSETLAPLLGRFVDELESQLLTEWFVDPYDEGMYLEPAIEEKLRGNIMEQIAMFTAATGGPIMLRSEARAMMNLKTLADDKGKPDKLIVPMTAVIDGEPNGGTGPAQRESGGIPGAPPTGGGLPPQNDPNSSKPDKPANQNGDAKPAAENDTATRADENPARHPGRASGKALTKARASDSADIKKFTESATAALQKFAKRQAASISSSGTFNTSRWNKELAADLFVQREKVANHFGEKTAKRHGSNWDGERITDYNMEGSSRAAEFINGLTHSSFQEAHDLGDYAELGEKILSSLTEAAVDTVHHMAAFGAYEAVKQTGKDAVKTWHVLSDHPRPTHEALDGESVGLHDTFSNGLRYPHDPAGDVDETAGCKCELEFSVSDTPREELEPSA